MRKSDMKYHMIASIIMIIFALVSLFGISRYASSPETYKKTLAVLDEEKEAAFGMTAAAEGLSIAISFLPGDSGSPISNELTNITMLFAVSLCAIYLEKYMLTVAGFLTFGIFVPVSMILLVGYLNKKTLWMKKLAVRFLLFGLAIFAIVPLSVKVSSIIKNTYEISWDNTLAMVEDSTADINKAAEAETDSEETSEDAVDNTVETEESTEAQTEKEGFIDSVTGTIGNIGNTVKDAVGNTAENVADAVGNTVSTLTGAASDALESGKLMVNKLIETAVVMIVTSCLIPLLVLVFVVWMLKLIVGVNVNMTVPVPVKHSNSLNRKEQLSEIKKKTEETGKQLSSEIRNITDKYKIERKRNNKPDDEN